VRIDPALAALKYDRDRQRRAQAAMAAACHAWRGAPEVREVLAAFERFAVGAPLADCPALAAAFTGEDSAQRLAAALVRECARALTVEPFGHPPFRHGYDRGASTLLLARHGRAQLVLHAREPGSHSFHVAGFSDAERHEAVLAGRAKARIVCRRGPFGRFADRPLTLEPGVRLALDLREDALQLLAIERRLVSLRLHRAVSNPGPSREYCLVTGALLRQSAGDIRTSRREISLALLGRMRRAEAAPVMAALARRPGDASLRWQAVRECLALDTAAGFSALAGLAGAADDPLARPAAALRAQLLDAHPELRAVEPTPCPA